MTDRKRRPTALVEPATWAMSRLLSAHCAEPVTAGVALVIGGGLGYGMVHAPAGSPVRWFVSGRPSWHADDLYLHAALERCGLSVDVAQPSSLPEADETLRRWRDQSGEGFVVWVDATALPWWALPSQQRGFWVHPLWVKPLPNGQWSVDDQRATPEVLEHDALCEAVTAARRPRLLRVHGAPRRSMDQMLRLGLAACVAGMDAGHTSFGVAGLRQTSAVLFHIVHWRQQYPTKGDQLHALFDLGHAIKRQGGLMRALFADGLTEASAALRDEELRDLRDDFAALARKWATTADVCLPGDSALDEAQRLRRWIDVSVHQGDDANTLADGRARLAELTRDLAADCQVEQVELDDHRVVVAQHIAARTNEEVLALDALKAWLSAG